MKAQYAQEISSAQLQIQDFQKTVEETLRRAEEAEAYQKSVQSELAEAKVVQKYNAQLHKDLQREQLARKKLHNDMEDMKGNYKVFMFVHAVVLVQMLCCMYVFAGKIRVYVRVRPFSKTELAKNCEESVVKDGKMTVLVKGLGGPDTKKYYDFDQVRGVCSRCPVE
jgi:predicted RNase H-like nuclease (RuvC/YqgF family)